MALGVQYWGCWGAFCLRAVVCGSAPGGLEVPAPTRLCSCHSELVARGGVLGLGRGLKARLRSLAFVDVTRGILDWVPSY